MSRIKKRGLDYFPMNTDFTQDRSVRRIMRQEGDGAFAVLFNALSYIYAGEGYFVRADTLFYEDLAASLFEKSGEGVKRIICLAVEYGIFDTSLFSRFGILTSAEIQRQYLFSTKRRKASQMNADYCLLSDAELAGLQPSNSRKSSSKAKDGETDEKRTKIQNVTFSTENVTSGTHSIAKHSIAQQRIAENSKELPPPVPPKGKNAGTAGEEVENDDREEEISPEKTETGYPSGRKQWTQEFINTLQPPADGIPRNYEGLLCNLLHYHIPPSEQYAIIRKSNYGIIGNPVWKGFSNLRNSCGKIKLPGRYLLSVINVKS